MKNRQTSPMGAQLKTISEQDIADAVAWARIDSTSHRAQQVTLDYPVDLQHQSEGGYLVTFRDVPEAITQGNDKHEALWHAIDALETALSFYVDAGKPLPKPSRANEKRQTVRPSPLEYLRLTVYQAMIERRVTKAELASHLNWDVRQVDRLLDIQHVPRINDLEAAMHILDVLGRNSE